MQQKGYTKMFKTFMNKVFGSVKNTKEDNGLDKSTHRQHTTKYEDLCQ